MSISIILLPWAAYGKGWKARMNADADRLIETLGDAAYATAADSAWREDMGFLRSRDPGHWSRVTLEIGRRLALADSRGAAPVPRIAAGTLPADGPSQAA